MSWTQLLHHERTKKILQRAILENKVASAYLFWGLEGIGKEALAIEFAKTLNCLSPIVSDGSISACDTCKSCKQIASLSHPNLQLVFSLPTGKGTEAKVETSISKLSDEQLSEVNQQLKIKAKDPYHKISIANANQIKIASIREVKKNLTMSSSSKGRRVVIVINAEEMTNEASNAFLKTLEEPHENITIILTTSKKEMLMQTILSRCQQIHCEPIPDDLVARYVHLNYGKDTAESRLIADFAQGSISRAVDFLETDMQAMRSDIIDTMRSALKKNYRIELNNYIEKILAAKDKNKAESSLKLLQIWMRDLYIYIKTQNSSGLVNQDQLERIIKFAELFPNADVDKILTEIEESIIKIRRNVNLQLILLSLFLNIRKILLRVEF